MSNITSLPIKLDATKYINENRTCFFLWIEYTCLKINSRYFAMIIKNHSLKFKEKRIDTDGNIVKLYS